jgi:glutamine synthetase
MPGSSCSIACPNMIMNTIVAEALSQFSDVLESSTDFHSDLNKLIHDTLIRHRRILFNGNNYSDEWHEEAEKRGLSLFSNTVEALPHYTDEKNIRLFEKHRVLSPTEVASRQEVLLENYTKVTNVECLTLIDLVKKDILPSVLNHENSLLELRAQKKAFGASLMTELEDEEITFLSEMTHILYREVKQVEEDSEKGKQISDTLSSAQFAHDTLFADMARIRSVVDRLETRVAREYWPYPTYSEILYSVK